jgi:BirA family biotin operon repressor/biotin-[acetyl-CoA-carboxylase] ligase
MKADIIWLDTADSTNDEARRHISDIDNLSVLSVLQQTAGRGQRGNTWSSSPGQNLTFSIVLKFSVPGITEEILPSVKAYDQFVLTEIASVSMVSFLFKHGIDAKIKWPNDIYVGCRKICGMLIENSVRGSYLSSSIIGIGLNINQKNFDVTIPNPTSMGLCKADQQFDIHLCLEEFIEIFKEKLARYLTYQTEPERNAVYTDLRHRYLSNLWLLNEEAHFCVSATSRNFIGIIRGLSPIGLLRIEDTQKGELREFAFKEISYIL